MPNASSVSRANPACSYGACLQRSIYIKRKDIPSTVLTRRTGYRVFRGEMVARRCGSDGRIFTRHRDSSFGGK